jgi:AraC family transcriptional regulator
MVASRRDTGAFRVTFGRYAPAMRIPRHDHEMASLCIALSGGYKEQLDRRDREVETGTLVIHPQGEAHANQHAEKVTGLLTIEFSRESLELVRDLSPLFDESWDRKAAFLLPLAYRIFDEMEHNPPFDNVGVDDLIWRMIADIADYRYVNAGRPAWLLAVRDYLESHVSTAPSIGTLAAMVGVHPVHLGRAFRRAFGCGVGDFVWQRRIAAALKLLADSDLGLGEISAITGFADQSHMTRRIGAMTGRPPGAWRRLRADQGTSSGNDVGSVQDGEPYRHP